MAGVRITFSIVNHNIIKKIVVFVIVDLMSVLAYCALIKRNPYFSVRRFSDTRKKIVYESTEFRALNALIPFRSIFWWLGYGRKELVSIKCMCLLHSSCHT